MSKSTSVTNLLSFIFFYFLASSNAIAASFDCTQAKSNMEKAICNDSSLSELDEKLGSEYKTARLKLSPPADKAFVASQRSWLRFHSTYCFIDVNASSVTQAEAIRCLESAYKDRIEDLKKLVISSAVLRHTQQSIIIYEVQKLNKLFTSSNENLSKLMMRHLWVIV